MAQIDHRSMPVRCSRQSVGKGYHQRRTCVLQLARPSTSLPARCSARTPQRWICVPNWSLRHLICRTLSLCSTAAWSTSVDCSYRQTRGCFWSLARDTRGGKVDRPRRIGFDDSMTQDYIAGYLRASRVVRRLPVLLCSGEPARRACESRRVDPSSACGAAVPNRPGLSCMDLRSLGAPPAALPRRTARVGIISRCEPRGDDPRVIQDFS